MVTSRYNLFVLVCHDCNIPVSQQIPWYERETFSLYKETYFLAQGTNFLNGAYCESFSFWKETNYLPEGICFLVRHIVCYLVRKFVRNDIRNNDELQDSGREPPRGFAIYPDLSRLIQIYSDSCRSTQIRSDPFRSNRIHLHISANHYESWCPTERGPLSSY